MLRTTLLVLLSILTAGPLLAEAKPLPVPMDGLTCRQLERGALLEWNFVFFAPILAWVIQRDGEDLTKLPPEATSYFDPSPGGGSHVYNLRAINFDGTINDLAKCEVVVVDSGLRCKADGNKVALEWGPILIDILILKFRISRDGDTIATVPAGQLTYGDEVFSLGVHQYAVYAVTSPDSEFLVGTCAVEVTCFGIKHAVSGLTVSLAWDGLPIASPLPVTYLVTRDDQLVAKTLETEIKDTVPSPGSYLYQVVATLGLRQPGDVNVPDYLIGSCRIEVPREPIPAPRNLVCTVEWVSIGPVPGPFDPTDPTVIDANGDGVVDSIRPVALVRLRWTNPTIYDKILIARNKAIVTTIEGTATSFVDRVRSGGEIVYSVIGIVGNLQSAAAECKVVIPPPVILPPQGLTCQVLDIREAPIDPAAQDVTILPSPVVVMTWWNPIPYAKLVILRDGEALARIPGDSTTFHDFDPPGGVHVYGVFGIVDDGRNSPTVECKVEVGIRPVPPVFNLQCLVSQPSNNFPGSVILVWENAAAYDRILLTKDGELLFEDTGELRKFIDRDPGAGVHEYCVVAVIGNRRSRPTCCQVVIEGPPPKNLLYFTPTAIDPVPVDLNTEPRIPEPLPPIPGSRITCLADNIKPLQAWSFGVASDPTFIVPRSADLRGTATQAFNGGAGPDFVVINLLRDGNGVTMAVVIETDASASDPSQTLPVGRGHRLLNIEYAAGPRGSPGEVHPIKYSDGLGSPPVQTIFVVEGFETTPCTRAGWVSIPGGEFLLRGDANSDGRVDISDAKFILVYLFLGGRVPGCMEAANANGSTLVNIADPVYLLNYLFLGGPTLPHPYPFCGRAMAPLGCENPGPCFAPGPLPQDQ